MPRSCQLHPQASITAFRGASGIDVGKAEGGGHLANNVCLTNVVAWSCLVERTAPYDSHLGSLMSGTIIRPIRNLHCPLIDEAGIDETGVSMNCPSTSPPMSYRRQVCATIVVIHHMHNTRTQLSGRGGSH